MRTLDAKCVSLQSAASKHTVAQLSGQTPEYTTAFFLACTYWDLRHLVRCALQAEISADTETDGTPMLAVAAQRGSSRALKALIQGGANLELMTSGGSNALLWAARQGQDACVQLLLDAGADANARDCFGNTPLMTSVAYHRRECAQALIPVSDLLLTSNQGNTAIHTAVHTASAECFEMLLPLMPDVDVRTVPGVNDRTGKATPVFNQTSLHVACEKGMQSMCKALVARGASRLVRDSLQRLPLHWAARLGHLSCVLVLVGRPGKGLMTPAEVDAADVHGFTALHLAAGEGFEKICGVLLQAGARYDARSWHGSTPLMFAEDSHPTNAALHALLSGAGPAQLPGTVCEHCGKTAEEASVPFLKTCGACHGMRFCSADCIAAAWPAHKAACRARAKEREEMTDTIADGRESTAS